ncbi:MAG: hypothetical protein R2856_07840 [Caldilineaceae bacterium]
MSAEAHGLTPSVVPAIGEDIGDDLSHQLYIDIGKNRTLRTIERYPIVSSQKLPVPLDDFQAQDVEVASLPA